MLEANELLSYWQIASETRHALMSGAAQYEIEELADELEGMARNTDNPTIRRESYALLALCRPTLNKRA